MTLVAYVDSSVALKLIFDEPESETATNLLNQLLADGYELASSQLLNIEVHRVLFRVQGSFEGSDELLQRFNLVPMAPDIARRAALLRHEIKTLDAIHVATALEIDEPELLLVSHDNRMKEVGTALGLTVRGI